MAKLSPVVRRFARNLTRAREAAGLTRSALAKQARVSAPYITQLEQAQREPSIVIVMRLAKVLKVGVEALLT